MCQWTESVIIGLVNRSSLNQKLNAIGSILHFQCKSYYAIFWSSADFFAHWSYNVVFLDTETVVIFSLRRQEPIDDDTMAVANPAMQGARASAAMLLT